MREWWSHPACCFLIKLNQLPCSYCLLCVRKRVASGCRPTVSACLFEIISSCLWEILFSSLLSLSLHVVSSRWERQLLASRIFHLSSFLPLSAQPGVGSKNYIFFFLFNGRYKKKSTRPGVRVESEECEAGGGKWSYWCFQRCGKWWKSKNPEGKKNPWKEKCFF